MISKFLEKKVEICKQENTIEPGNMLELEYYLVESDDMADDFAEGLGYGVEIIKKELGMAEESKMFKNIYCDREATRLLIEKLAFNNVTPVSLPYILDDSLGVA